MSHRLMPDWQQRRSQFNHDWLKNKFLNNLGSFLERLNYINQKLEPLKEFIEIDFFEWEEKVNEAYDLIDSFEVEMSPKVFFKETPLKKLSPGTGKWLEELIHKLWLNRLSIVDTVSSAKKKLDDSNERYVNLKSKIDSMGKNITVVRLKELYTEFKEFKKKCTEFSKNLSEFPMEVKVA